MLGTPNMLVTPNSFPQPRHNRFIVFLVLLGVDWGRLLAPL